MHTVQYAFPQKLAVTLSGFYHLIYHSPFWQASNIPVIDKHICLYLSAEMLVVARASFFRKITVHGIKLYTTGSTPLHGIIKKFSFSYRPKNQFVAVGYQCLERVCSKRYLFAYLRIHMLNDSAIKIYSYCHNIYNFRELSFSLPYLLP